MKAFDALKRQVEEAGLTFYVTERIRGAAGLPLYHAGALGEDPVTAYDYPGLTRQEAVLGLARMLREIGLLERGMAGRD